MPHLTKFIFMQEINSIEDIKKLVDSFYAKVKKDKDLAHVFNSRIASDDWPLHLNKMYRFWESVLFHKASYKGNPFEKHVDLPVKKVHFNRWIKLFIETVDENFYGSIAEDAKMKAKSIAYIFSHKILGTGVSIRED